MCEKSLGGTKKASTSALYLANLLLSEYLQTFILTGKQITFNIKFPQGATISGDSCPIQ